MDYVPLQSRQIDGIGYDEQSAQLMIKYATGKIQWVDAVTKDDYQGLLQAQNQYDMMLSLLRQRK
ncbi:KTSC domain-containing protein [Paenibacillus sp. y28]|uniref:KTSC domain-containing protein n=1 Tax=Paenibacillus sp. y28 TaxID=3129110 RepID=UPI003015E30D